MTHYFFQSHEGMGLTSPYQNVRHQEGGEHAGVVLGQWGNATIPTMGNSSSYQTHKPKDSQVRFLYWVAYERNNFANIDEQQIRTCPLIGCERYVEDPESFRQHVHQCPHISNGLYRCTACYAEERTSKCLSHICNPVQPTKRRHSLVKSLKSAKRRLFSHRTGKGATSLGESRPTGEIPYWQRDINSFSANGYSPDCEISELPDATYGNATELEGSEYFSGPWIPELPSMRPIHRAAELGGDRYFMAPSTEAGCNQTSNASSVPRKPVASYRPAQCYMNGTEMYEANSTNWPSVENSRHSQYDQSYPNNHPTSPVSPLDGWSSPISMTRDSTVSSVSTLSTCGASVSTMSSLDFEHTNKDQHYESFTSFFDDDGPRVLFDEPESFDSDFDIHFAELEGCDTFKPIPSAPLKAAPTPQASPPTLEQILGLDSPSLHEQIFELDIPEQVPMTQTPPTPQATPPLTPSSPDPDSPQRMERIHRCVCGYAPEGKEVNKASNLKRHRKTCKRHAPYLNCRKKFKCPDCGKGYTRSDNLLTHQRKQGHLRGVELSLRPFAYSDSSSSESGQTNKTRGEHLNGCFQHEPENEREWG